MPGGGGSGPDHWQSIWEQSDTRFERVQQKDWDNATEADWIKALNDHIQASSKPTILVAHSLGCITAVHWAHHHHGSILGSFLVAPADVEDDWASPPTPYADFRPLHRTALPFPSLLVASSNDPYLSINRAQTLSTAWGSDLHIIGPFHHIGDDSGIGGWEGGKDLLENFIQTCVATAGQ